MQSLAIYFPFSLFFSRHDVYRSILGLSFFIGTFSLSLAQTDPNWVILSMVSFEENQEQDMFGMPKPIFSQRVLDLSGEMITLDGYIYPLEKTSSSQHFVLSSLPISSCFFCGQGGPETVVEIYANEPIQHDLDHIVVKGKLLINESNPSGMIYVLEGTDLIK